MTREPCCSGSVVRLEPPPAAACVESDRHGPNQADVAHFDRVDLEYGHAGTPQSE